MVRVGASRRGGAYVSGGLFPWALWMLFVLPLIAAFMALLFVVILIGWAVIHTGSVIRRRGLVRRTPKV